MSLQEWSQCCSFSRATLHCRPQKRMVPSSWKRAFLAIELFQSPALVNAGARTLPVASSTTYSSLFVEWRFSLSFSTSSRKPCCFSYWPHHHRRSVMSRNRGRLFFNSTWKVLSRPYPWRKRQSFIASVSCLTRSMPPRIENNMLDVQHNTLAGSYLRKKYFTSCDQHGRVYVNLLCTGPLYIFPRSGAGAMVWEIIVQILYMVGSAAQKDGHAIRGDSKIKQLVR